MNVYNQLVPLATMTDHQCYKYHKTKTCILPTHSTNDAKGVNLGTLDISTDGANTMIELLRMSGYSYDILSYTADSSYHEVIYFATSDIASFTLDSAGNAFYAKANCVNTGISAPMQVAIVQINNTKYTFYVKLNAYAGKSFCNVTTNGSWTNTMTMSLTPPINFYNAQIYSKYTSQNATFGASYYTKTAIDTSLALNATRAGPTFTGTPCTLR